MLKKSLSAIISIILVLSLCICTCSSAFAASSGKKYVKDVILSYGETEEAAKQWLIENDYEVLDSNLNEGADSTLSKKRAVYLGYKTTDKKDEAITDMKLMNMKGGYSVQDYQMILSEQKDNIKAFFDNFKVAVQEYRNNYAAGQERAIAAHDMLNMLYDDDTQQNIGDLLLNRVKEEYTDEEFNALSAEEQAKVGDMTTILMQGNANAVTTIEQLIATATDETDTLWTERYLKAQTYDEMLENLMDSEDLTVNDAEKELASKYDDDAKQIAINFEDYKTYVNENYVNCGVTLESTEAEIEAYEKANEDFDLTEWLALGTQYELLKVLTNDDVSLYDMIFGEDYDITGDDMYLLYPLVSVLTNGQRACLDFLPTYQLVALGINDDEATKEGIKQTGLTSSESLKNISVYEDVDRSIFSGDVAMTGDAYKLQASTGKNATENWLSSISTTTLVMLGSLTCSAVVTGLCWKFSSRFSAAASEWAAKVPKKIQALTKDIAAGERARAEIQQKINNLETINQEGDEKVISIYNEKINSAKNQRNALMNAKNTNSTWAKVFKYAGVVMTCITIVLLISTIWSTVDDLIDYYNATYTPIPSNMVNQGVNDDDEKVYTYYKAVKCNRVQQGMVTDKTELLGDNGDINGDVGKQWVALYTTKDSAAGNPITVNFRVQYNNTKIPDDRVPLSIFCESTAQNLTNEKSGYTYSNGKNGIYLFYGADESAFAGSVISDGGYYVLVGGGCAIVAAAIAFFVGKSVGKKGKKEEDAVNA